MKTMRIRIEVLANELCIPKRRRHENIRLATTPNQISSNLLTFANHPLSWRGFMIDIPGINFRAMFQQKFGDLDRARKVQRSLTIAAARMHKRCVSANQ